MYLIGMTIKLIISNITFVLLAIALIFAFFSLKQRNKLSEKLAIIDTVISWYMLFCIGVHHTFSAVMLIFFGHEAAKFAGWPFSPFANEVGFANLSFAIMGFIAFKASRPFQNAILLSLAFFQMGAFCGHFYQFVSAHNLTSGNTGLYFWSDLLFPILSFIFILFRNKALKESN